MASASQLQPSTDWEKCCLCQKDNSEKLILPTCNNDSQRAQVDGYSLLSSNIQKFHSLNKSPLPINPKRLDDGTGILKTLKTNNATFHDSCRLKFNNTKLIRAEKRSCPLTGIDTNKIYRKTPRVGTGNENAAVKCFLCDKSGGGLREASTIKINEGLKTLWIAFGQGASAKFIPIHDVVSALGRGKTDGIIFFHAFTGCDTVSAFRGKGKKSAWRTWSVNL